jgi:tape measure domain-containing protein
MNQALTFILKLQDMLTPGMRQAAQISNTSANKISSEFEKINSSGRKMAASVNELRARLDAINQVRFSTTLSKEFDIATRSAQRLENQIEKLEKRGNKGNGLGGLIAGAGLAYGTRDVISTGIAQNSIAGAINFATDGHGQQVIGNVKSINNKYGLSDEAGLEGFKTIAGGTRGLGYSLQQQADIYEGVGAGVAGMGLSAEQAKLSFLALGQMASKGKVSAEELRGQLGEQIPGALGIAARAMGVSQQEFNKMLDKGEVVSSVFLPKFAAQMKNEFGPAALAMAEGPQAQLNRFNNQLLALKTTVANELMPAFLPVLNVLQNLALWVTSNADVLVPLAMVIGLVVLSVKAVTFFTSVWNGVLLIMNATLWANPITWVVAGIIALIAAIGFVIYKTDGWAKQWDSIIKFFKLSWEAFKDYFHFIWLNVQDKFLTGIEFMEKAWYKLKSLWDEDGAAAGLAKINSQQNQRATEIAAAKGVMVADMQKAQAALKWEMKWNDRDVVADLKRKFGLSAPKTASALTVGANDGSGGNNAGFGLGAGKEQSAAINQGGQRSIVIHIAKAIEKLEQHIVGGGKEAADEFASAVREALNRELRSLNGVA